MVEEQLVMRVSLSLGLVLAALGLLSPDGGVAPASASDATMCGGSRPLAAVTQEQSLIVCPDGTKVGSLYRQGPPFWSRDGRQLAVFVRVGEGKGELRTGSPADPQNIVATTDGTWDFYPWAAWSPDGTKIATMAVKRDGYFVRVFDLANGDKTTDFPLSSADVAGSPFFTAGIDKFAWSPDGKKLLLSWGDVLVIDVAGGRLIPIAGPALADWAPSSNGVCYLPHGSGLSMRSFEGLFLRRLDEDAPVRLAGPDDLEAAGIRRASWLLMGTLTLSPDATQIAFTGGTAKRGEDQIHIFKASDNCIEDLTKPLATIPSRMIAQLDWSPDGTHLAAIEQSTSKDKSTSFDIEVIALPGGARTKISTSIFTGTDVDALGLIRFISWSR